MLNISSDQMNRLAAGRRQSFCATLRAHLHTTFPKCAPPASLEDVQRFMEWTSALGIDRRYDVQRVAELLTSADLPLAEQPRKGWIAETLGRAWPSGTACANELRKKELGETQDRMDCV